MDAMTYTKCEHCGGSGSVYHRPDGTPTKGCMYACRPCGGKGWHPTGLTLKQLDAFADRERALAGDPGLPEDRRRAILLKLANRVARAVDRLTADVGGEG